MIRKRYRALVEARFDAVSNSERPGVVPTLSEVEWAHIIRVIRHCDNNLSQAARLLGVHRRTLTRKLAGLQAGR